MKKSHLTAAMLGAVAIAASILPMSASNAAAAKAGQACKTVGQKSGTLVCTKVGSKLRYQAPATTTAAPATAAPTTVALTSRPPVTASAPAPAALPAPLNDAKAKPGGILNYFQSGEIASLDPLRIPAGGTAGFVHAAAIFDTLMRLDKSGEVVPQLAAGMASTDNGKTWTLKLRPGINFTDKTPLNAEAVVFNMNRFMDPRNNFALAFLLADVQTVRAVDDLTVLFTLVRPVGSFPVNLTDTVGLIGSPTAIRADAVQFGRNPVGAGPMVFKEWVRDDRMEFTKNPDYFNKGRILLDGIRIKPVADGAARGQALLTGQADIVYALIDTQATVSGNKGFYVWGGVSTGGYFLLPNLQKKPGNDRRIREALALMMDPAKTNQAVYNGAWREANLGCFPFTKDRPECVANLLPTQDVDKARALVQAYRNDGNSLEFNYLIGTVFQAQGDYMLQAMRSIGLQPRVSSLAGAEWLLAINAGNFDVAVYARSAFPTPYPYLNGFFESKARNLAKQSIPELDAAFAAGSDAPTAAQRIEGYKQVQRIMARDHVVTWMGPWFGGFALKDALQPGDQVFTENARIAEMYFTRD